MALIQPTTSWTLLVTLTNDNFCKLEMRVRARELTVTVTDVHGKQATSDRRWLDIT